MFGRISSFLFFACMLVVLGLSAATDNLRRQEGVRMLAAAKGEVYGCFSCDTCDKGQADGVCASKGFGPSTFYDQADATKAKCFHYIHCTA